MLAMSENSLATIFKSQSNLLTNEESASYLGVAPNSLAVWRTTKRYALPYIKVARLVKYRQTDLDPWLESRTMKCEFFTECFIQHDYSMFALSSIRHSRLEAVLKNSIGNKSTCCCNDKQTLLLSLIPLIKPTSWLQNK